MFEPRQDRIERGRGPTGPFGVGISLAGIARDHRCLWPDEIQFPGSVSGGFFARAITRTFYCGCKQQDVERGESSDGLRARAIALDSPCVTPPTA